MLALDRAQPKAATRLAFLLTLILLVGVLFAFGWWRSGDQPRASVLAPKASAVAKAAGTPDAPAAPVVATPTSAATVESQVPATVVGYRPSAAQRDLDASRFQSETDLAQWARELQQRAATGDADAAARLHEVYRLCASALVTPVQPRGFYGRPAAIAPTGATPPAEDEASARCRNLGPVGALTAFNLNASAKAWSQTAAQLGQPAHVLLNQPPRIGIGPVGPAELRLRDAAMELLRQRDWTGLLSGGDALDRLMGGNVYGAWQPVLCRQMAPCGAQDPTCRSLMAQCNDYGAGRTARDRRVRAGQIAQIEQAVERGDLGSLWREAPAAGAQ